MAVQQRTRMVSCWRGTNSDREYRINLVGASCVRNKRKVQEFLKRGSRHRLAAVRFNDGPEKSDIVRQRGTIEWR